MSQAKVRPTTTSTATVPLAILPKRCSRAAPSIRLAARCKGARAPIQNATCQQMHTDKHRKKPVRIAKRMTNKSIGDRDQERTRRLTVRPMVPFDQHGEDQQFTRPAPERRRAERAVPDKAEHHGIDSALKTHPGNTRRPDAKAQRQHGETEKRRPDGEVSGSGATRHPARIGKPQ